MTMSSIVVLPCGRCPRPLYWSGRRSRNRASPGPSEHSTAPHNRQYCANHNPRTHSRSGRHSAASAVRAGGHADMPGRRLVQHRARDQRRERAARSPAARCGRAPARRRRSAAARAAGSTGIPAIRQVAARRGVLAIPAGQALARHRRGQRHAVVQPVLQRDEQSSPARCPGPAGRSRDTCPPRPRDRAARTAPAAGRSAGSG